MSGLQTDFDMPWQRLKQKWENTKTLWNDPVSREFEEIFMVPLGEQYGMILILNNVNLN